MIPGGGSNLPAQSNPRVREDRRKIHEFHVTHTPNDHHRQPPTRHAITITITTQSGEISFMAGITLKVEGETLPSPSEGNPHRGHKRQSLAKENPGEQWRFQEIKILFEEFDRHDGGIP